ncbi:MAG: glycoside hydrolase family 1 protein [Patescibacteria group bacterium]
MRKKSSTSSPVCATCKIHDHDTLHFPSGFLWGAATSSHQVEGGNENEWSAWEREPGNILDGTESGDAADQWNRYESDFDLAQKLGHTMHRLSVEWSRIEPEPGQFDEEAIAHYRDMLHALKDRGMTVMLTLHHFTNPIWFANMGGWESRKSVALFERFVRRIIPEFREYVDLWCTINEPNVYASNSFLRGEWPPQRKSVWAYYRVTRHLARAHRRAYKLIHAQIDDAKVGIAQNVFSIESYQWWEFDDYIKMRLLNYFWNHHFFSLAGRRYQDYIGVNYYFHVRIRKSGIFSFRTMDSREEHREGSDLGWELYPNGLFQSIMNMRQYGVPIYVTENGLAAVNDHRRSRFMVGSLKETYHAIRAGADVRGYCYWSLIDNFEWNKGFAPRFGMIEVDYKTQKRTPRNSAFLFAHIAKMNGISHDMFRYLGHSAHEEPETYV